MPEPDSYVDRGIAEAIAQSADQPAGSGRGCVTPAQAQAGVATVDRIAGRLHRDMIAAKPRYVFMRAWEQFYNRWISYKVLSADRLARSDPARVVERDLPEFVRGLLAWRNALVREGGKVHVGADVAAPTTVKRRWSIWHVFGVVLGGWGLWKGYQWLTAEPPDVADRPVLPNPAATSAPTASTFPVIPPIVVYPPPAPLYPPSTQPYGRAGYLPAPRAPYAGGGEADDDVLDGDDHADVIDVEV